ncbi:uroporphyrinogen-III synthase [Pleomorphomonas sp. NRK KF1]|uniref:uroporphyrinogen-III synthase n=1 Tax=Pleomorphomonas sp. NRK KF1 TaxID=2943000 RepID=UPI002043AF38|nr:uroporphyrinogen-III synthase [Pleomorphomonas sp. NRK KF1]MCM5554515.1 uroporphyrinogen-III synthase [Pleomorphomonas sp. NRK KF1]
MVLLVLRPEPQASDMVAALAGRGVPALAEPMLSIEPATDPVDRVRAADPDAEALILTSRQTVAILKGADGLDTLTRLPVIAVGGGTAHDARAAGFTDVRSADGNADDLVDLVARAGFHRLVHAGGRDKAGDIAGRLATLGVTVSEAELYRAEPRQTLAPEVADAFAQERITGLIVASRRSAQAFLDLMDTMGWTPRLARLGVVALSEAAAAPLAGRVAELVVAAEPTGPALVDASVALAARLRETVGGEQEAEGLETMTSEDHRKDAAGRRNRPKAPVIDLEAKEVAKAAQPPKPPQEPPREPPVPEPPAPQPPEPEKPIIEPPGPDVPPIEPPPGDQPPIGDPPQPDRPMMDSEDTGANAATEAAAPPRTDRPSQMKTLLPLLGAGLVGGCAAALVLLAILPVGGSGEDAGSIDPATLETRLGEVADRLAAGQAAMETLGDRIATLEGRETPAVDLAPLGARVDELAARLDAAEKATADRPTVDPAAIATLEGRLAELTTEAEGLKAESAALAPRLAAIEERLANAPKGGEIAALSLALTSLSGKIDAGLPFSADLAVIAAAAPDLPGLDDLRAVADQGVPTRDRLLATLPVDAMLARRPVEPGKGWMEGVFDSAKSLVNYRETGPAATDPASGAVEAIRDALKRGDAAAAKAAADTLPAWARPPAESWLAELDARVRVDAGIKAISARIVDRLSVPAAD